MFKYNYNDEINISKLYDANKFLCENLTFAEICKLFREIAYQQVCYYSENDKGIIYEGQYPHKKQVIEQATRLQQMISCYVDLFEQSIDDKRVFDEEYLKSKTY